MGLDIEFPQGKVPQNAVEWARTFRKVPVKPSAGSVTPAELSNTTTDLIDNTAQSAADAAQAASIAQATTLATNAQTAAIASANISAANAQSAAEATASTALAAHVADSNPHPVYLTQAEGDSAYVLQSNVLSGSATYDPPSLADGAATSTTVTVTGAALGDFALASFSLSTQGIALFEEVTAANTVTVVLFNKTGGPIDLASGTLRVRVWK